MEPKRPAARYLSAPARGASTAAHRPVAQSFPPVDDHVVRPETREELVRGRRVVALPAKEPHAERHHELDYLLRGCVAPGYVGATDLLTRAGEDSDFATDSCIRRAGIDPATKTRYLEELAFEIVGEQTLRSITERAEDLTTRGVRRVVAIFAKKGEVREWSPQQNTWIVLDREGEFEDPTLVRPIAVAALLEAAKADDEVARALHAKGNRVIAGIATEAASAAGVQARRATLLTVLDARGISLTADEHVRIEACTDVATLDRWARAAATATSAEAVFAIDP